MAITRAASAAARDEMLRLRRASAILARGAAAYGRQRASSRLAVRRFAAVREDRLARFNRKMAKYSFCQLIGDISPVSSLERILGLAQEDIDIVAADPGLRAGIHQAVRVARLLTPGEVSRVNRRWRAVKYGARKSGFFSY
jgi:hypothetical protein